MAKSSQKNMTTELVDGRECTILELSNKDKLYFIDRLKGKEVRKIKPVIATMLSSKDDEPDLKKFFEALFELFPVLVLQIKTANNIVMPATMEYYDDLDSADDANNIYLEIQNRTIGSGSLFKKKAT